LARLDWAEPAVETLPIGYNPAVYIKISYIT